MTSVHGPWASTMHATDARERKAESRRHPRPRCSEADRSRDRDTEGRLVLDDMARQETGCLVNSYSSNNNSKDTHGKEHHRENPSADPSLLLRFEANTELLGCQYVGSRLAPRAAQAVADRNSVTDGGYVT